MNKKIKHSSESLLCLTGLFYLSTIKLWGPGNQFFKSLANLDLKARERVQRAGCLPCTCLTWIQSPPFNVVPQASPGVAQKNRPELDLRTCQLPKVSVLLSQGSVVIFLSSPLKPVWISYVKYTSIISFYWYKSEVILWDIQNEVYIFLQLQTQGL